MSKTQDSWTQAERPEILFICGAVGSGNSFLFECLTEDQDVYGINEDGFGGVLRRIEDSEKQFGKCPHAIAEFVVFLQRLRSDRKTLILKTPANLYHVSLLSKYIPRSRVVCTLRSPHSAIVSGMARHQANAKDTSRYWLEDAERIEQTAESTGIITFEALVGNPVATLQHFQKRYYQLPESVFKYSAAKLKPSRQDPNRWERKVSVDTAEEIRRLVAEFRLEEKYDFLTQRAISAPDVIAEAGRLGGMKGKIANPGVLFRLALRKLRN